MFQGRVKTFGCRVKTCQTPDALLYNYHYLPFHLTSFWSQTVAYSALNSLLLTDVADGDVCTAFGDAFR